MGESPSQTNCDMAKDNGILDLVLKHKWFDMIAKGEKKEEYREIKPFYENRLTKYSYSVVRFHRGYSDLTMDWKIKSIKRGIGKPEWGAPEYPVFIIALQDTI